MIPNNVRFFVFIIVTGLLLGCGATSDRPPVYAVTGKVIFNGEPVEGAQVTFRPKSGSPVAMGTTLADGSFELTTYNTNDGAIAGEHAITISKASDDSDIFSGDMDPSNPDEGYTEAMAAMDRGDIESKSQLPAKYADPDQSGLLRSVTEGTNDFVFELEPEAGRQGGTS